QADHVALVDVGKLEVRLAGLGDVERVAGRGDAVALAFVPRARNPVDADVVDLGIPVPVVVDSIRPRFVDHAVAVVVDPVTWIERPSGCGAFPLTGTAAADAFGTAPRALEKLVAEVAGCTAGYIRTPIRVP